MNELISFAHTYIRNNFWLLFRYGLSGVSGIIANLIVFAILVEQYGVWYLYASIFGFIAAYIVTFTLHKFWTFAATNMERTLSQSVVYLCTALVTLGINSFILFMLVHFFNMWPVVAQALSLGVAAGLSFLFTSHVTFHQDTDKLRWFFQQTEKVIRRFVASDKRMLISLFVLMSVVVWYRFEFFPLAFTGDARGFIGLSEFMLGRELSVDGMFAETRYLKPLGSGFVALLMSIGMTGKTALLTQALLMYYMLGFAAYWFGRKLFANPFAAFMTAFLVVTSYPIVRYGLNYFMETGAWALYFLSLAAIALWAERPSFKYVWWVSLTLLAGLLWKEYAVLAGATLGLVVIFHQRLAWSQKLFTLLQVALLVLVPWCMWQVYIWVQYEYSYIDWLLVGADGYEEKYVLTAIVKSLFILMAFAWPLVLIGLYRWRSLRQQARAVLQSLAAPSFGFLLWGFVSSRLFFSLVPLAVPLAVHGLLSLRRYSVMVAILIIILLSNALLLWVSYVPDVREFLNSITYG